TKSGVNVSSSNRQGINSEPSVRLFPNPVNRNAAFSIELGNVEGVSEVSIFDQMGRLVYQQSTEASRLKLRANTVFQSAGLYIVKVSNPNQEAKVLKLIAQ
ncbi:MAG: T9SS type A sorting domain-containing protein, partial [Bacteroidota bacterium]